MFNMRDEVCDCALQVQELLQSQWWERAMVDFSGKRLGAGPLELAQACCRPTMPTANHSQRRGAHGHHLLIDHVYFSARGPSAPFEATIRYFDNFLCYRVGYLESPLLPPHRRLLVDCVAYKAFHFRTSFLEREGYGSFKHFNISTVFLTFHTSEQTQKSKC